jgi:hypothetical protein
MHEYREAIHKSVRVALREIGIITKTMEIENE